MREGECRQRQIERGEKNGGKTETDWLASVLYLITVIRTRV